MFNTHRWHIVALGALGLSLQTNAQPSSEIFKCKVDGGLVYQSLPCANERPAPTIPQTSVPQQIGPSPSSPARLNATAEARRAEQTRQREEIQKNFRRADAQPNRGTPLTAQQEIASKRLPEAAAVDRMTTYTTVLGRGIACGAQGTDSASRRFGAWMDAQGLSGQYLMVAASGIKYAADQQREGRSPDSCASVRRTFASFPWP